MNRRFLYPFYSCFACLITFAANNSFAQGDAKVSARIQNSQVLVGDHVHVFYEVQHDPSKSAIRWAALPDSLGKLEIVDKTKIDTVKQGGLVTYKQVIDVAGFDSGAYYVPSFQFSVIPKNGAAYTLNSDSLPLLVQTVAVDTTKDFKPIKGIIAVHNTWRDYIWWIVGGLLFIILAAVVIIYFIKAQRAKKPVVINVPKETLQEKALKLLAGLEEKQMWQKGQIKEYYVQLTNIVRGYVEARFDTAALELTTDELLDKARITPGIMQVMPQLEMILRTADMAKFAKAQPTPMEHTTAMQMAKDIVTTTRPVVIENPSTNPTKA